MECAPDADEPSVYVLAETETDDYILVFFVEPVGEGYCDDLMLFFGIAENMKQYNITQCQDGSSYIIEFEMNGSEAV